MTSTTRRRRTPTRRRATTHTTVTVSLPDAPTRAVINAVLPAIDGGRFPIKRTPGETVDVTVIMTIDGHDRLSGLLLFRRVGERTWRERPLTPGANDRWTGSFLVEELGEYEYTAIAWMDDFASWREGLSRKWSAGQEALQSDLLEGAALIGHVIRRTRGRGAAWLRKRAQLLRATGSLRTRVEAALDEELHTLMMRYAERTGTVQYEQVLRVTVERVRARVGAWYEFFPRSAGPDPSRSATFREAEGQLPAVAKMGFDVLYLPPIHPIGVTARKGPNNTLKAGPNDPGSPWAIGSTAGGHMAIEPALGALKDFAHFVEAARKLKLEVALDLAFQCSRDHPYLTEHPEWFRWRHDGSIQFAQNPPKQYQDIVPFDFTCREWQSLWHELLQVVRFWIAQGIRIFRVDNPHTKPVAFWDWLIRAVQAEHPDTIFLAEAFTRPAMLQRLAKGGFSQSYTYFTWRNNKQELTEYVTELMQGEVSEYVRPNLFTNTPDILHEYLQVGGRPAFQIRAVLAATLGATYGIYGPAFELCDGRAVPGTEEYHDSEKYQVRAWDHEQPGHIRDLLTRLNQIRRANTALHYTRNLRLYQVDNERLFCFGKVLPDGTDGIIVVVNLNPHFTQSGWVWIPVGDFGLQPDDTYQVHDLLSDARFLWRGESNFVQLDPSVCPAHIFRVRRRVRHERDFDYFL